MGQKYLPILEEKFYWDITISVCIASTQEKTEEGKRRVKEKPRKL
jgi:hypothetical protein